MPRLASALVAILALFVADLAQANDPDRPNILFILADDLGWRDTGVYGSTYYETPNIDALATDGMRFMNAYSASPLCSPTRASILTGQYPGRLRLTTPACHLPQEVLDPTVPERAGSGHKACTPGTRTRLPNEYFTIAEALKEVGYTTGFFGKWHLGRAPYYPEAQGFDVVVGGREHPGPPGSTFFAPWPITTIPAVPEGTHICDTITDEAIKFLETNREGPFFMAMWFYDVHAPFQAKEQLKAKYALKKDPQGLQDCPTMGGMIEVLDQNIGRLLAAVEQLDIEEETLIIFTSDNGGNMYNTVDGTTPTNNSPLRNGKGNIYEGGQRVPLIVVWPGKVEPGTTNEVLVSSVDYYPTILEVLELSPQEGQILDGQSITSLFLQDDEDAENALSERAIFCHFPHYTPATGNLPATSVREGDYKLLRFFCDNEDQTDRLELYDLSEDIGESKNLAEEKPELAARLNGMIEGFLEGTGALRPIPNPAYQLSIDGWDGNDWCEIAIRDGALVVDSSGSDPFITTSDVPGVGGPIIATIRVKSDSSGSGRIFWSTRDAKGFRPERGINFPVTHDGQWREYTIELPGDASPLTGVRLDPCTAKGTVSIDSIKLHTKEGRAVKAWTFGD